MSMQDDYEFLNSELWLKYTQDRYAPIDDIRYRLEKLGHARDDWNELKEKIQKIRRLNAIPLNMDSIEQKFWYFPADCIQKKINKIEYIGHRIFEKIESSSTFKDEFLVNAALEEAITSAIYEGASSTRAKAKQLIASEKRPKNNDEWMLINNYRAMTWIKSNIKGPVSHKLILNIHEIVTKNTLEGDDANFSGKCRDDVIYVGKHTGVDWKKIPEAMNEAIELSVNNQRYLHGLIKGIILHYFIAYVHPFFDGNGRTARTIFYYKCMKNDLKFVELLSISAHLKEHGKKYEKSFDLVKEHDNDITYFVDYCLESILFALGKVEEKVNYLLSIAFLREDFDLTVGQITLLQKMALNKFLGMSAEGHAKAISRSREIARQELKSLYEKGLLREEKSGKKLLYFVKDSFLKELVAEKKAY